MFCWGMQMRQFWGQQQRFFKEMANASKVEFVVARAKEALSSGMSVVVGLQSTGESGMDKVSDTFGLAGVEEFLFFYQDSCARG